jgi:transcriptional regulator with XRE-family HTH domain
VGLLKQFGAGLQRARKSRGLTQEDFALVSSRTYLSSLERGLKAPTITKIDELAAVIGVHPLALMALAYMPVSGPERRDLWERVLADVRTMEDHGERNVPQSHEIMSDL